jgi:hypothetical protein
MESDYVRDGKRVLLLVMSTEEGLNTINKTDMALTALDVIPKEKIILECCERTSPYLEIIY